MIAAPERSRQLRPAPRQRRALLRSQGVHPHQPARRHVRGRMPGLGVGRGRRGSVGAAAALGAQADHRQEHPRLHAAWLQDRARGDRPRRPAAPHAGQRVSRRVLLGVADAAGLPHHARAVPRRGPQAVREEVRQARRSGRELQHGGHDQGLRAGARDQRRRARSADRSTLRGQALLPMAMPESIAASGGMRHGLPHDSAAGGQPARHR